MVPNAAIRNLIREDKVHQIYSQMQVGQQKHGMQTLNQSLYSLYARRMITLEEAMGRSNDVEELRMMIEGRVSRRRRAPPSARPRRAERERARSRRDVRPIATSAADARL